MTAITYLDFDFEVQRHEGLYRGKVLASPAGQAFHDFQLPFTPLELENFFLRVGRARRGTRRVGSPEMEAARAYGRRLFEATFGGEVRACFRSSLDDAARQGKGLRIRLRLTHAPELTDLAWEYLCNPALGRFLSLSVETPLVRYLELPEPVRPIAITAPLHVLVAIASPHDHPRLDVELEWLKLHQALGDLERKGLVTLERLSDGTLTALQQRLRGEDCHVFHFIGHGGFNPQSQDGVLIFEDPQGKGHEVSGEYLGTLLHDHRPLRLALLNACEGARTSVNDPFAGVAQTLVQQGVPAVIAMQFEITDDAAITLAQEFYGAIADGYPVDGALAEARKAIFAQGNDIEWGTPVLYMRAPDGRIFAIERHEEPAPAPTEKPEAAKEPERPPEIAVEPSPEVSLEARADDARRPATSFWRSVFLSEDSLWRRHRLATMLLPVAVLALLSGPIIRHFTLEPPTSGQEVLEPSAPKTDLESLRRARIADDRARATIGDSSALQRLIEAAHEGNVDAQYAVGRLFADGTGVPQDITTATEWLTKAAAQGSAEAQQLIGRLTLAARALTPKELGERASRGDAVALTTLQSMAEGNDAAAQYQLALLLASGKGLPKDTAAATRLMRMAAAQGHPDAVAFLAKPPIKAPANPRCSDLLQKQSLGVALSAEERAALAKECK